MLHFFMNFSEAKKDPNIEYLSGYSPSFCILVYDSKTSKKCMFISSFEIGMYKKIKCFSFNEKTLRKDVLNYFNIKKISKIGVNFSFLTLKEAKFIKKVMKTKIIDISSFYNQKREIKNKREINLIKESCTVSDKILSCIMKEIKSRNKKNQFRTEKDIYNFIKRKAVDFNVELAFDPIVATGKNASFPHHVANNSKLKGFTIIDIGIKKNNYCSDMTRTFYFGNPKQEEIERYYNLLNIQQKCVSMLKKGYKLKKIDIFAKKQLKEKLNHSIGHGIGILTHELPYISSKSKETLKNGMCFTIEPGIYEKNKFGIRIEDTICFIDNKVKILSKFSKKLIKINLKN